MVWLAGCGMRIFKDFGHHINRFGMSFEIDEGKLELFCTFKFMR